MTRWYESLDGFLGRLVFRFFGVMCAVIAMVCAYAAWWHVDNPIPRNP